MLGFTALAGNCVWWSARLVWPQVAASMPGKASDGDDWPDSAASRGHAVGQGQEGVACREHRLPLHPAIIGVDPLAVLLLPGKESRGQFTPPVVRLPCGVEKEILPKHAQGL